MNKVRVFLIWILALAYLIWPVDLMPGLPFDDVIALIVAIALTKKSLPRQIAE